MSNSAATTTTNKPRQSRLVTLSLPPSLLARFLPTSTPVIEEAEAIPNTQQTSESNATSVPGNGIDAIDANSLAPPAKGRKRGGAPSSAPRKRAPPSIDPNGNKERARPGPKKKPRLADGTIDHAPSSTTTVTAQARPSGAGTNGVPAHRLGPKANTGAINAGLRALDRSGKPCRKWERKGFSLKSFTGTSWAMPSWKAPPKDQGFPGDVKSDGSESMGKVADQSSRVGSSREGDQTLMMNGMGMGMGMEMESSPAPVVV